MVRQRVLLINPLGSGLAHYTRSLEWMLTSIGADVAILSIYEPSASGRGRFRWLWEYCRLLLRARAFRRDACMIITWPVSGYWDFAIARLLLGVGIVHIVVHDPEPLVRAAGYGWLARYVAGRRMVHAKPVVHSEAAANRVRARTPRLRLTSLPHPMFEPRQPRSSHGAPVVRVLGQYKSDRDVDSLRNLAATGGRDWHYEIVGRGWPGVPGWKVSSRYVSEAEFDALICGSSVVLVPYRRFFQSGVAIRCLEMGVPVVGPGESSLVPLLGEASGWLVHDEAWLPAVTAAIGADTQEIARVATRAYAHALGQWRDWLLS